MDEGEEGSRRGLRPLRRFFFFLFIFKKMPMPIPLLLCPSCPHFILLYPPLPLFPIIFPIPLFPIIFPIPYSLSPIPYPILFPIPYPLFPIPYSLFPILFYSLFFILSYPLFFILSSYPYPPIAILLSLALSSYLPLLSPPSSNRKVSYPLKYSIKFP